VVGLGGTGSHVPAELARALRDIHSSNTDWGFTADLHDSQLKWQARQVTLSHHTCNTRLILCSCAPLILSGWFASYANLNKGFCRRWLGYIISSDSTGASGDRYENELILSLYEKLQQFPNLPQSCCHIVDHKLTRISFWGKMLTMRFNSFSYLK
jgi:hypothetical protein